MFYKNKTQKVVFSDNFRIKEKRYSADVFLENH
jgi:hypothetical protein